MITLFCFSDTLLYLSDIFVAQDTQVEIYHLFQCDFELFNDFWCYLKSVFKQIEKGTSHKYRLSPPTVIEELKITLEEMIDLNLRILRSKEAKKIQKRVTKAEERNQLKPPQSLEEIYRAKNEAQREAFSLHWQGMSKSEIANLLGISERTVYRYLKGT